MAKRPREFFPCPHCGDDVPAGAKACPHCGADEETGWAEDADYTALELPRGYRKEAGADEEDDDAGEFAENAPAGLPVWVKITLVIMCLVFAALALIGR